MIREAPSPGRGKTFAVLLTSAIIFFATYFFAVKTKAGQAFEATILTESDFSDQPALPLAAVQPIVIVIVLSAASIVIWRKTNILKAIAVWFIAGFSMASAQLTKSYLARQDLLLETDKAVFVENTLPSGHMSVFVTICVILLLLVQEKRWSATFSLTTLILAIVVWQLLDYGWHRPSDLLAASSMTVFVFALIKLFFPKMINYQQNISKFNLIDSINRFLLPVIIICILLFLGFVGFQTYTHSKYALGLSFVIVFLLTTLLTRLVKALR